MKNKIKNILMLFISILVGIGVIFYQNRNYYEMGEIGHLNINKGESFTIRIHENGSTGYVNCWINENKCNSVKFVDRNYNSRWFSNDCVGCGGTITWRFTGISNGCDTIKISSCPVGPLGKACSFFSEDSIALNSRDSIAMAGINFSYDSFKNVDYTFIVEVLE